MSAVPIELVPVVMTAPRRWACLPEGVDPAKVRFALARDVRAGDVILARVNDPLDGPGGPYVGWNEYGYGPVAEPRPLDPGCCGACAPYADLQGEWLALVPCSPYSVLHLADWEAGEWAVIVPAALA